jgi:hypothetical protein
MTQPIDLAASRAADLVEPSIRLDPLVEALSRAVERLGSARLSGLTKSDAN